MSTANDDSPDCVVLSGFPRDAVRVVASRQSADAAYVLLDTNPKGWRYLYGINCERVNRRWTEGSSGNGSGWARLEEDLGTLTLWEDVTSDADRARASFAGELFETAVEDGVYLFAWWNVPCPDDKWPRLEALRVRGEWLRIPFARSV